MLVYNLKMVPKDLKFAAQAVTPNNQISCLLKMSKMLKNCFSIDAIIAKVSILHSIVYFLPGHSPMWENNIQQRRHINIIVNINPD